jgi:FkbM family methyltransferase
VWHYRLALEHAADPRELKAKLAAAAENGAAGPLQRTEHNSMDTTQSANATTVSDSPDALYRQAQEMASNKAHADAIGLLERALSKTPDFALAHNDLAVLYYHEGQTDRSYSHYKEAVRIEPDNAVFLKNLADFDYFVNDNIQSSLEIYVDLLKRDPQDQEVLLVLGLICKRQGKMDDAAVFYRRVLEIDPTNADALQGLQQLSADSSVVNPISGGGSPHGPVAAGGAQDGLVPPAAPSPVVRAEIRVKDQRHVVQIPEQETFRIKAIFEQNEYGIPAKRRGQGVFTVFDVGANVGLFALHVHTGHPDSRVYCFEPSPVAQDLLAANVGHLNGMNICNYGLYNRDMQTDLNLHSHNTGQNSIRFSGRHYDDRVTVDIKNAGTEFDRMGVDHLDVLKIDTEGCEVQILESLGPRLDRIDYVLLEYHTEQDRRTIDQLLAQFHLFGAHTVVPGVGTVKYMHPSLV